MASTYKTPGLKLNQWLGSDRPKREDFNYDNITLETALLDHIGDGDAHLGGEQKEALETLLDRELVFGSYIGTDATPRVITLNVKPRVLIVYALSQPLAQYVNEPGANAAYMAIATAMGASLGLQLVDDGFVVTNTAQMLPGGRMSRLNAAGVSYVYIAIP